jgi:phosphoribosylformylglycinamidine cyclo-ligase
VSGELSYRDSGVDREAARRMTRGISDLITGEVAGFAAALPMPKMRNPRLLVCTDGVGTKLLLAQTLGRLDGLGQDLVAMCVNDLITSGGHPVAFLDYLAVGELDPADATALVASIADACDLAGCALAGGETAEMPGLYAPGHFDLAGFALGVVEADEALGPERVSEGDLIVGIASSGLHSNGFSLVRALIADGALAADPDLLLTPTALYPAAMAAVLDAGIAVASAAHITGGGLPENLPRALPDGLRAHLDTTAWPRGAAVDALRATGRVSERELWETFNMGVGFCLIAPSEAAERATELIEDSWVIGEVAAGERGVDGLF